MTSNGQGHGDRARVHMQEYGNSKYDKRKQCLHLCVVRATQEHTPLCKLLFFNVFSGNVAVKPI